ncbi:MAG: hypothetical protein WCG47_32175, partial [Dermatophilaceae bacterium]
AATPPDAPLTETERSSTLGPVLLAIVASVLLVASHAAISSASLEPENGTATSQISVGNDTSASGGKYVKFGAQLPSPGGLDSHNVVVDGSNKIVSWVSPQDKAYAQVSKLAWDYLKALPDLSNGKPAYYSHSYLDPSVSPSEPVGWPHNPAGLYAMFTESALAYYQYSGDSSVLQIARGVVDHHIANGMTSATDNWAKVPYASGDVGSLTYNGASYGNTSGAGDGKGVLQPDKIGELGVAFVQLYKLTGDTKYLNAAIDGANALASHVRTGSTSQSPWPFRVVAATGNIKEQYCAHVISPIELFDNLTALGAGNTASYQSARTTAWNWLMNYPMQNNNWSQYFEDVDIQSTFNGNLNQLNAMMTARYLLLHPEMDPSWEAHVRGLITWVESTFARQQFGATIIEEQFAFAHPMGSHTSRYASVNALLYQKTGDTAAKEKAYRSYNWATYMARSNGVVIDGPEVNNQWFTDGYGDYIRHFIIAMGAVPQWAPAGEDHLLQSNSLVKSVSYTASGMSYQTYDNSATEELRLTYQPTSVTAGGVTLSKQSDLSSPGWTYDATTGVLRVYHSNSANVQITK